VTSFFHVRCASCTFGANVAGSRDDLQAVRQTVPEGQCPVCGQSTLQTGDRPLVGDAYELEVPELYAAINGLGLPHERQCTLENVVQALAGRTVNHIEASEVDNNLRSCRLVVRYLQLDDGTRLYFGAGLGGAVLYRIRRKHALTEQLGHEPNLGLHTLP
jgi:hypothetical protein